MSIETHFSFAEIEVLAGRAINAVIIPSEGANGRLTPDELAKIKVWFDTGAVEK